MFNNKHTVNKSVEAWRGLAGADGHCSLSDLRATCAWDQLEVSLFSPVSIAEVSSSTADWFAASHSGAGVAHDLMRDKLDSHGN